MIKLILRSISLSVALGFFYLSSFFTEQFGKHNMPLKIVVAIALSVVAVIITILAEKLKEMLKKIEQWHVLLKAMVRFVVLVLASVMIFLIKYPRFKTDAPKTYQKMIFGNRCFLFSLAAFSAYSLLLSGDGDETLKLGISDFFLGMTMEASMGINDNNGKLDLWYTVGAAAYCFLLILYKSCGSRLSSIDRNSTDLERRDADRRSGHIGPNLSNYTSFIIRVRNSDEGHQQLHDENNDRSHQIITDGLRKRKPKPEKLESDVVDGAGPIGAGDQSNNTSINEDGRSNTSTDKGDQQSHYKNDRNHQISTDRMRKISFKLAVISVLSAIRFMPDGHKDNLP